MMYFNFYNSIILKFYQRKIKEIIKTDLSRLFYQFIVLFLKHYNILDYKEFNKIPK